MLIRKGPRDRYDIDAAGALGRRPLPPLAVAVDAPRLERALLDVGARILLVDSRSAGDVGHLLVRLHEDFRPHAWAQQPYIVFLLAALLPWMWFTGAVSDCTRAYLREAKLIRSTKLPRTIWVNSLVLSKGIEFLASIPVLAVFAIITQAPVHWQVVLLPARHPAAGVAAHGPRAHRRAAGRVLP